MSINRDLRLSKSIEIHADRQRVWDTLTTPEKTKQFFAGTEILTDWNVGSPIIFQGKAQGGSYQDRGNVLAVQPGAMLQYNYWTDFSGLEDRPENYAVVTFTLQSSNTSTLLQITRVGFANEQEYQYALAGWEQVLEKIKAITEEA